MKRTISLLLAITMVLTLSFAAVSLAEASVLDRLGGMEWCFSSGAGGWSTDLWTQADGSFTGEYHDSEMGETGEGYPDGTIYVCRFSGQMSVAAQVDEKTWKIRVDKLTPDEGQVPETIEDGVRYVTADAYGLSEGDEMLLYAPGTPVSVLSEEMQLWAHVMDQETSPAELEDWFLMSEKNNSGFVGWQPAAASANPWEDLTAEELAARSGVSFRVPEGAKNAVYRYMSGDGLAEMQFTFEGDEFCARTQAAAEPADISGMYYSWTHVEEVSVCGFPGTIGQAQDGKEWVELCQWHGDGRRYSLSVRTPDPDGLDLTALADQIFGK